MRFFGEKGQFSLGEYLANTLHNSYQICLSLQNREIVTLQYARLVSGLFSGFTRRTIGEGGIRTLGTL
jgi:hypothetical protein